MTMKKAVALTLAVSSLFLAGCCTSHHAKNWEYTTIHDPLGVSTEVNKMVSQGWVVAGFSVADDINKNPTTYYLMKRPKQ